MPYVPVAGFPGWNITERMKYYGVPGVSIAVIKDFKLDWAKGYGLADTVKKIPVTDKTMFSAGSISKFVFAVTALQLVEQGKMNLDSPINKYLRSWKIADNSFTEKTPVTLRMLLSHTGGTTQSAYFGFTPDKTPLPTIPQILRGDSIAESRPVIVNNEPGKEFRYSGGGIMIAQMAVMDVTKQDFASFTKRTLFDKLGMNNSTFQQPLPLQYLSQASSAYSQASWFKGMPYVYPQQAAAGLYTTPSDLAAFFIEVQKAYQGKSTILSKEMSHRMLTAQAPVSKGGYNEEIGIGPFLLQRAGNTSEEGIYMEFTGVNAGFLAYGIGDFTDGNGVVIMLNSGDEVNGLGKEIRRSVAKVYNWYHFLPDEIHPVSLPDTTLNNYTGRYRRGTDEVIYLRKEKNYLVENVNEGADIYCFPVAKDTIVFTDFNVKGYFQRDKNGAVLSLQSTYQGKPMPKMSDNEHSPTEWLRAKEYSKAKEGYRSMNLTEYQITYLAYNLLHTKEIDYPAIKMILELAQEQHPNSSVVYSRWGDYYISSHEKENALNSYKKALELDPSDKQTKDLLKSLLK